MVASATTAALAEAIGSVDGDLDVPASISAAIESRAASVGLSAAGLWAQVPHYAAGMPSPAAAEALLECLERVAGVDADRSDLTDAVGPAKDRLDELVAQRPDAAQLVSQLERYVDQLGPDQRADLPTGDELADEIQRFLGELDSGDPGPRRVTPGATPRSFRSTTNGAEVRLPPPPRKRGLRCALHSPP